MSQLIEEERLFEDLCYASYLRIGFEQVKENKGKPGIDGVSIQDFEFRLEEGAKPVAAGVAELDLQTIACTPSGNSKAGRPGG